MRQDSMVGVSHFMAVVNCTQIGVRFNECIIVIDSRMVVAENHEWPLRYCTFLILRAVSYLTVTKSGRRCVYLFASKFVFIRRVLAPLDLSKDNDKFVRAFVYFYRRMYLKLSDALLN